MAIPPTPYHPPRSLTKTQTQIVRELDPDWRPAMTGKETEFEFSNGRKFEGNPTTRYPSAS